MTHEEIREAIKQVQAHAMSLHRRNLEIAASIARSNDLRRVECLEWWGVVMVSTLVGVMVGVAFVR